MAKSQKLLDPIVASSYGNELAAEDIAIEEFVLKVFNKKEAWDLNITKRIIDAQIIRTIEGASSLTVTLHDPNQKILNSKSLQQAVDVKIDGFWYRLVGLVKNDDMLDLVFEDRDVSYLRSKKKVKHVSRAKMTRAEFMLSLVREVKVKKIPVVVLELHKKQPVEGIPGTNAPQKNRDRNRSGGIEFGDKTIKVKGQPATRGQVRNMNRVMAAAEANGATPKALVALVEACIVENEWHNTQGKGNDAVSFGILQNIPGTSAGVNGTMTLEQAKDIEYTVKSALLPPGPTSRGGLIKYSKQNPGMTPGQIAADVINGGGDPRYAEKCNSYRQEAQAIIDAYGGGSSVTTTNVVEPYIFTTRDGDKAQNYWDALGRLCDEVGWSRFMSNGVLYICSEHDLFKSRPRMKLREGAKGIQRVNFNFDVGRKISQATVICRAERWIAPPGTVVQLDDCGAASGKWLVSEITRSVFDVQTTITLKKPKPELKEPAPEVSQVQTDSAVTGDARNLKDITLKKDWGGTLSIFEQFVTPFMARHGLTNYTGKRTPADNAAVGGAEDSDHLTTNTDSYAIDYSTTHGLKTAKALATAMGYKGWEENSYTKFDIRVGNRRFSVQILWGAGINHGDHIHVGIRRIRPGG